MKGYLVRKLDCLDPRLSLCFITYIEESSFVEVVSEYHDWWKLQLEFNFVLILNRLAIYLAINAYGGYTFFLECLPRKSH